MEQTEEKTGTKGSSDSNKGKPLKIEEGKNYLRIFPIHPKTIENLGEESASNMYPASRYFMDTQVKYEKRDGTEVDEIQRRPHLNSKVHGGTDKCLADEYINFAYKIAYDELDGDDEISDYLYPIKHFQKGVTRDTKWPCYVKMYTDKQRSSFERGIVYFPVSVINKMNEQSAENDDPDGVIETDIFSDVEEGYVMIVTKDPVAGKKDPSKWYSVATDIKGGEDPLSDEDLGWLMEQDPLDEKFLNIYKASDFTRSLDALKAFDKNPQGDEKKCPLVTYNIFSYDEFLDTVEEIAGYYPEEDASEEDAPEEDAPKSTKKKDPVAKKTAPAAKKEAPSDLPFDTPLEEMSKESLEGYIRRNKLAIRVSKRHTVEDLVEFIKEEEEISAQSADVKEPEPEKPSRARSSRLAELEGGLED